MYNMEQTEQRTFTKAFQPDLVRQRYPRKNIPEVAKEFEFRPDLISEWRRHSKGCNTDRSFNGIRLEKPTLLQGKGIVKKQQDKLRGKCNILKKGLGIFGKTNG